MEPYMKKLEEALIERKTKRMFKDNEIPSVYALVQCYRAYQEKEFSRELSFKKALEEFIECVLIPLEHEYSQAGCKEDFYAYFIQRAFLTYGLLKKASGI